MTRRAPIATIALLGIGVWVGACGSGGGGEGRKAEEERVQQAIQGYLAAVADGDGKRACRYLTRNAQLGVFEFKRVHVSPEHPDEACADVVQRTRFGEGESRLRQAGVEDVRIDGRRATAMAGSVEVVLRSAGDAWRIDVFGLASDVSGTDTSQLE